MGCTIDDIRRDREHLRNYPYPSQLVYWQSVSSRCRTGGADLEAQAPRAARLHPVRKIDTETFCGSFDLIIAALTESIAEAGAMRVCPPSCLSFRPSCPSGTSACGRMILTRKTRALSGASVR